MIPEGLLVLMPRGYGRMMFRAQRGYEQMLQIRAWCGCRPEEEMPEKVKESKNDITEEEE